VTHLVVLSEADAMAKSPDDAGGTVEKLFATALRGVPEATEAWEAIHTLHRRGGEDVFTAASALLDSRRPQERARGADILAGLEQPPGVQARAADRMLPLLRDEQDAEVLHSLIASLGHGGDPRVPGAVSPLRDHPSARVRGAVLLTLLKFPDEDRLSLLLTFADDPDEGVRSLAMLPLRNLFPDADPPGLRDLLVRRMDDVSPELRAEAVLQLARRKDPRVLAPLRRALRRARVRVEFVEAAGALGDPSLLPALRALEGQREEDPRFQRELTLALTLLETHT
jgi:HEAT repeat protein